MKNFNLLLLITAALSMSILIGCNNDEDDPDGIVNFDQSAYNITTDDLGAFEISFSIEPAAPEASEIVVSFSGATPGTEFTTTPAASGGSVTIPVAEDDTEASFTFIPNAEGIGFDNVNVDMSISSVGSGLTTGLTTESQVSITNTLDTGTDLPYSETFESCGPDVELPGGFEGIVEVDNSKNTAGFKCVLFGGVGYAASNPFSACGDNESDPSRSWLVSPRLNLTETNDATLTFDAALVFGPFDSPDWDVVISTDYNGDNFEGATWERLEDAFDQLGEITRGNDLSTITQDLSAYSGNVVTIAIIHVMPGTGCENSGAFRIGNFNVQ